jgi:hypothetical protein
VAAAGREAAPVLEAERLLENLRVVFDPVPAFDLPSGTEQQE